jgi:two-component system nitrate/nitrite response regulator NarL
MIRRLRILLVDDHSLFRKGVAAALAARPGMEVVGEACDGREAIALARETQPDVILMDIAMPHCSGLEATKTIAAEMPLVKIVILTVSDEDDSLFEALKLGAQGYLTKDLKAQQLYDALEGIARGEATLSGALAARVLREFPRTSAPLALEQNPGILTARETEVLQLLARGSPNKEIAAALVISESTVKNHIRNIVDKLHVQNRVQAALFALQHGLVSNGRRLP